MIESAAGQYDREEEERRGGEGVMRDREEEESCVEEEQRQSQERPSSLRQRASRACIIDCPGLVLPSLVSSRAEMVWCRSSRLSAYLLASRARMMCPS